MRVLESVNEGQGDISSQHRLVLVVDRCDEPVEDEGRAIALHPGALKLRLGLGLQRVDVGCLVELSQVDLLERLDLAAQAGDLGNDLDDELAAGRDQHIIHAEYL